MTRHTIEPAMLNKMASITNLVYYASVAKGTTVLAEHKIVGEDLATLAVECLEKVPPLHSRFTYTTKRRMFNFLMDDAFTYCAIMDEALGKRKAFAFLERVRDEFKMLLRSRGSDGHGLEAYGLVDDFAGVFRHLVKPLVGVPQKDIDRWEEMQDADGKDDTFLDAETSGQNHAESAADLLSPLTSSNTSKVDKKSTKHQVIQVKEIMMTNSGKALDKCQKLEGADGEPSSAEMHSLKAASNRVNCRQVASRMWWRNVKLVLILDLAVCCILFAIWLGICRGFNCVKS